MRLTSIVLVAAVSIFVCCQGALADSDSKSISVPQHHVHTENNANRLLRVHQDEEERAGPQLVKSLSEKFSKKAAEKLTRSKSFNDFKKLDDVAYKENFHSATQALYQRIEKMGFNPDGMLKTMRKRGDVDLDLLAEYTRYWMRKYPTWTKNQ
ncbi:hypothetical protein DVH05_000420 [Phytophthora capsici]|nr:hypothetical protein DVH05_000420 [Phytophthora capsici]